MASASTISTGLYTTPGKILVGMYDFDKTMVVNSFGEAILLDYCDPNCSYESCDCTGDDDLANALKNSDDPEALVLETFGGQERLDRVKNHFETLVDAGVDLYIVSTSWYAVPATAWANFIFATLEYAGLEQYFPIETILTLDDPGEGEAADKGLVIREKLEELGLDASDAIFSDDSEGNFLSAVQGDLSVETLYVQPRTGLSNEALSYIEERAEPSMFSKSGKSAKTIKEDSSKASKADPKAGKDALEDPPKGKGKAGKVPKTAKTESMPMEDKSDDSVRKNRLFPVGMRVIQP